MTMLGKKHSPETLKKLSISHMGQKASSTAFKKGFTPWNKGKTGHKLNFSLEQRQKLAEHMRKVATKRKWTKSQKDEARKRATGNTNRLGKQHSPETILKMSIAQKNRFQDKTKHPRWIDDRTRLSKGDEYRNNPAHFNWAMCVKKRDGWKCRIADHNCSGRMEAHHILGWKSHPDLRYQINNGITLCHFHHPRSRAKEAELSPYFQKLVLTGN